LARGIHKGLVTCNGEWPNQPAHVFSLHNPCLTEAELTHARTATRHKQPGDPLRLLFAGQLRPSKGPDRALRILAGLRDRGWNARLDLAGDGPRARQLHELAGCLGLSRHVTFHGWVSVSALHELYRDAHFFLLPSSTEGWPKVVGEAMAFRAVPLAGAVSCIAQVLDATGAGVALPPDGVGAFAASIDSLARNPAAWLRMAANGQKAAIDFTYEAYVERVRRLLRIEPACQTGAQVQAVRGTAAG
jgi:glycosyltransferase involved in cell wall biosynthesis